MTRWRIDITGERFQHLGMIEAPSAQEARIKAINLYRIADAQLAKLTITKIGGRNTVEKSWTGILYQGTCGWVFPWCDDPLSREQLQPDQGSDVSTLDIAAFVHGHWKDFTTAKRACDVALDLPTSWMMATGKVDDFTGCMFERKSRGHAGG
jgi:hypothetical protein